MSAFTLFSTAFTVFLGTATLGFSASIPHDFRVVAHFGSGYIPLLPDDPANGKIGAWYVRLDGRGVGKIEVFRNSPGKKTKSSVRYSPSELSRIVDTVRTSRFFQLPRFMDAGVTDTANYSLEVTMDGKTHRVRVASPRALRDKSQLNRFIAVWIAVCQKMPSQLDDGATGDLRQSS